MNFRLLLCIGMGVFMAHLAAFMVYFSIQSRRIPAPPPPPQPNFKYAEEVVTNPKTGTRLVNREITVTTSLRGDLYKGSAPQPAKQ